MPWRLVCGIVYVAALFAACAPAITPTRFEVTGIPTVPAPQPPMTQPTDIPQAGNESIVQSVVEDLAKRLNVPMYNIQVTTQEAVTWPDGRLGCPQPGMSFIQVPVEGIRIILSHSGVNYEYHAGQSNFVLCEMSAPRSALTPLPIRPGPVLTPESVVTVTQPIEPGLESFVDSAKTDLAARLSIEHEAVKVVSAQSVVWPDRSLGCPQPGMIYPQVLADGYRIELQVNNRIYAYHGGEGRGPFLCENSSQ